MIDYTLINKALKETERAERVEKILSLIRGTENLNYPEEFLGDLITIVKEQKDLINQVKSYLLTTLPKSIQEELKKLLDIHTSTSMFSSPNEKRSLWNRKLEISGKKGDKKIGLRFYLDDNSDWILISSWIKDINSNNCSIDLESFGGDKVNWFVQTGFYEY